MASRAPALNAALAALVLAASAAPSRAHDEARPWGEPVVIPVHGDYDWIRKGGYKGVDGSSCCGREDCDQIPATRVQRTLEGYTLLDYGLFIPNRQTQTSEDGKFWLCRDNKAMRCFFAPPPGS